MLNEVSVRSVYSPLHELITNESPKKLFRISKGKPLALESLQGMNILEIITENFLMAKYQLTSLANNGQIPSAILIDIPFSKSYLRNFTSWLNQSSTFNKVPVFYNKSILTTEDIRELQTLCLVDDILDIHTNLGILPAKCDFLLRAKSVQCTNQPYKLASPKKVTSDMASRLDSIFRRTFDIIVSLALITILLPFFVLVAIAIKLESKGPVFYISPRAGRGYKIFNFYKFRTMQADAEMKREELDKLNLYNNQNSKAQFFKIKNDPRITRLGALLRNTSLDEIPQLFNVLKGDMSIVGNRPLPLYEAVTLTTNEWAQRFMAPAGITGLWQIKKRGKEDMSVVERINLDISYAKKNDFLRDLRILVKTPTAMFQKTNV